MKVWSKILTHTDLHKAAYQVNADFPGCDVCMAGELALYEGPRTRRFDHVSLCSRTSTRYRNPGTGGHSIHRGEMAASWTEWGWWLSRVFEIDPDARANDYRGRDDFHAATDGRFLEPRTTRELQIARHEFRTRGARR